MNKPKIISDFYDDLVSNNTRMHSKMLFFKGSDFNSSNSSMTKVARIVSALANSGGGEIIYGIATKRGRAQTIEPVRNFDKNIDWLFHEIQSQIDSPVKEMQINIAEIADSVRSSIVHFIIPDNNNQPHMFSDSRYYKWQKNKTIAMDESEVRMIYGKLSTCELEFLGIYNTNGLPILSGGKFNSISFYPKLLIRNAGNIVEKDYKIEISFPAKLYEESFQPLQALFIRHEGSYVVFGQKGNYPIFQQEISTMIEAKINVNPDNIDVFLKENLNISLYFSNGIKKHSLKLSDTLTYNGKVLRKEDFTDVKVLKMDL